MTTVPVKLFSGYRTAAEWHHSLGNVPLQRIRLIPPPGTATEADAVRITETEWPCELIDGTLVEKAMGMPESFFAAIIVSHLWPFVRQAQLGAVCGADGIFRMLHGNIREPDVSFTHRGRLPNPLPQVGGWCPDLCVEVLSPSNTVAEMQLKRQEYFASGCQLVWEIDPQTRTAVAYTSAEDAGTTVEALDGSAVLPGFTLSLADLFAEYDLATPPQA